MFKNNVGSTPLHFAAGRGFLDICYIFVEYGMCECDGASRAAAAWIRELGSGSWVEELTCNMCIVIAQE